jgi:4-amino-4-deoxy-L-arabinose transferase-like glycosyltransferase
MKDGSTLETRSRPRTRRLGSAAGIVALALAIRVIAIVATPDFVPVHDPADYDRHAVAIASEGSYPQSTYAPGGGPSALRPPLYPLSLAAVYEITGARWTAGRLFAALAGALTVALIGLLAARLWTRRVALVAMLLAAVYPPLVLVSNSLIAESIFLPLMLAALLAALEHRRAPRGLLWPAAAGALLGLAILARPNGIVLLPGLAAAVWTLRPWRSARALVAPAVLLAAAVLVVAPWTVRNAIVLDAFVPVSTQDGYLLAGTYNDEARTDERLPGAYRPVNLVPEHAALLRRADLQEVELARILRERGVDYALGHPGYVAETGFWNTLRLLDLSGGHDVSRIVWTDLGIGPRLADAGIYGFYALAVLALGGAFTQAARHAPRVVWAFPLLVAVSVVFISGTSRYRMPIEPFLVMLAALALVAVWDALRPGRQSAHSASPTRPTASA